MSGKLVPLGRGSYRQDPSIFGRLAYNDLVNHNLALSLLSAGEPGFYLPSTMHSAQAVSFQISIKRNVASGAIYNLNSRQLSLPSC